ncbi:apiosidase-like domain-containing protein [Vagococcus elongatus]|uniref:Apiosidase-like catalytic domain-containing protein n=1 Tax=Vagococcus elongatus TaxID=180344 RepID=A0A430B462_9ENTE|nr:DUF4038 domain-containing protein [Vagococcus elongatus]RSU15115.1 hypothetical protein CBF29_01935 [Vagococcus elongatus]
MKMKISTNGRTLLRDGDPFFYLADTCWSAFTNIKEDEWLTYLRKRKTQGFNVLQINILPQWDRSKGEFSVSPFSRKEGVFDFSEINDDYFDRAKHLCRLAEDEGFTLALVVLWSNYVVGTWASELDGQRNVYPKEYLHDYFEKVVDTFDEFSPIYFIGGDTDFPTQETIETYLDAFEYFEKKSQGTLKTIHIKGRFQDIPEEIISHLDIFLYQSGHNSSFLDMPYQLANHFYHLEKKMPVINSEPCYEQMGFSRKVYGRFGQKDVRKAAWQSVLSGACAGITYGAHGIWSWHGNLSGFSESTGEAFDSPMYWQEALQLPGAHDYGFIKQLFELLKVDNLIPCNEYLLNVSEQIRMSVTPDSQYYLIYIPSNTTISVNVNFSNYQVTLIDFKNNNFLKPDYRVKENKTIFTSHSCQEDVLIVAQKQGGIENG